MVQYLPSQAVNLINFNLTFSLSTFNNDYTVCICFSAQNVIRKITKFKQEDLDCTIIYYDYS